MVAQAREGMGDEAGDSSGGRKFENYRRSRLPICPFVKDQFQTSTFFFGLITTLPRGLTLLLINLSHLLKLHQTPLTDRRLSQTASRVKR